MINLQMSIKNFHNWLYYKVTQKEGKQRWKKKSNKTHIQEEKWK